MLVAFAMLLLNVAKFVDRPNFVSAAKYITKILEPFRLAQLGAMILIAGCFLPPMLVHECPFDDPFFV